VKASTEVMIVATFVLMLFTHYSAREAHRHTHEAVNACSGVKVFDEKGNRL
jgi:hypothetical protein